MTPDPWQAVVLGAIQGATEFLPVSSSGHLVLVPALLGWEAAGLTYDTVVHWATALAVVLYYRADWSRLLRGGVRGSRAGAPTAAIASRARCRMSWKAISAIDTR